MGIKDLLLNKGWAGRTISRDETVDRINPIVRELITQMHHYDSAKAELGGEALRALESSQKTLRADIGKLCETIYSAGGVAESGTDMEPGDYRIVGSRGAVISALVKNEEAFLTKVAEERKTEHQMRTRAVLQLVHDNGEQRLRLLRDLPRG